MNWFTWNPTQIHTHRLCTQRPKEQPALSKGTKPSQDCHLWLRDTIRQSIHYFTSTLHASCFWVPLLLWCPHSAGPCLLLQQLSWDPAAWHSRHRYMVSKCTYPSLCPGAYNSLYHLAGAQQVFAEWGSEGPEYWSNSHMISSFIVVVQSLTHVRLFATLWTAAR